MKKHINVVGAAVIRDRAVLSAQRSATMSLPGLWEFPGGKIETGETPQQALVREVQEEFLCTIQVGDLIETTSYEYDFGIVTLTTYYASLRADEPQLTEHASMRWIPISELDSVPWAPADIPAVERIMLDHEK